MPYSDFDHNYCSVWLRVLHFVSPSFEMERLNETMFSNIIAFLEEPEPLGTEIDNRWCFVSISYFSWASRRCGGMFLWWHDNAMDIPL